MRSDWHVYSLSLYLLFSFFSVLFFLDWINHEFYILFFFFYCCFHWCNNKYNDNIYSWSSNLYLEKKKIFCCYYVTFCSNKYIWDGKSNLIIIIVIRLTHEWAYLNWKVWKEEVEEKKRYVNRNHLLTLLQTHYK